MQISNEDVEGLLLAALLGAIIGLDREYRGKSAGFRTIMMVSLGSALFSLVSFKMAMLDPHAKSDVTRIASNIATGIGFLGAGLIFRSGQDIKGLTTAATIWTAAAIGMAAGIGNFALAIVGTVITMITIFLLRYLEDFIAGKAHAENYKLIWQSDDQGMPIASEFFGGEKYKLVDSKLSKKDGNVVAEWAVKANKKVHEAAVKKMLDDARVIELEH